MRNQWQDRGEDSEKVWYSKIEGPWIEGVLGVGVWHMKWWAEKTEFDSTLAEVDTMKQLQLLVMTGSRKWSCVLAIEWLWQEREDKGGKGQVNRSSRHWKDHSMNLKSLRIMRRITMEWVAIDLQSTGNIVNAVDL